MNLKYDTWQIDWYCKVLNCSVEELEKTFKNIIALHIMIYEDMREKEKGKKNA